MDDWKQQLKEDIESDNCETCCGKGKLVRLSTEYNDDSKNLAILCENCHEWREEQIEVMRQEYYSYMIPR